MHQLLFEMDEAVDLSASEKQALLHIFRQFIQRHLVLSEPQLQQLFSIPPSRHINQQEDEDNAHAELGLLAIT